MKDLEGQQMYILQLKFSRKYGQCDKDPPTVFHRLPADRLTDIQCISSSSARVPGEVIRLFVTFLKVFLFLIFFYFLFYFNFSTLKLLKNNKRIINLIF